MTDEMFPDVESTDDTSDFVESTDGKSDFVAGSPVPVKDVKPDSAGGLGSAVRIPLGVGLIVSVLFGTCMGVPMLINVYENAHGVDVPSEVVEALIGLAIFAVFGGVIQYMMQRHVMRNWFAERRLGEIGVTVDGRQVTGDQMEVTVEIPNLADAAIESIDLVREVVAIEGVEPNQKVELVAQARHSAEARNQTGVQSSRLKSRDTDILWRDSKSVDLDSTQSDSSITVGFHIDEALAESTASSQLLFIDIEMSGWWFDWCSSVEIEAPAPKPEPAG